MSQPKFRVRITASERVHYSEIRELTQAEIDALPNLSARVAIDHYCDTVNVVAADDPELDDYQVLGPVEPAPCGGSWDCGR